LLLPLLGLSVIETSLYGDSLDEEPVPLLRSVVVDREEGVKAEAPPEGIQRTDILNGTLNDGGVGRTRTTARVIIYTACSS